MGFVAQASGARSHDVLRRALTAVARLAHRGAAASDQSGDGAGLLTQIPHALLAAAAAELAIPLPRQRPFAVGMFFLPREPSAQGRAARIIAAALRRAGLRLLGWRDVPVDPAALGPRARATRPAIRQAFVSAPRAPADRAGWERRLFAARRTMERRAAAAGITPFFVCSLSSRTIVYKALLTGVELPAFFRDLSSPDFETALAVFHQRYSTNTTASWPLVQPFRLLGHNGEINTLWGNRNAMRAREAALPPGLRSVIWPEGSDSAQLDNVLELLVRSGRDPVHAVMMVVPDAWERAPDLDPELKGFYEFHACLMEPWDGPAALAFTDGRLVGSAQDRNGLRPCRYKITRDGLVIAASEVGVADLDPADVAESGRLGPGDMLVVDTARGAILHSADAKGEVARRRPYAHWARRIVRPLEATTPAPVADPAATDLVPHQRTFGYGFEDLRFVLEPMGDTGQEAIWSMGDDTPIPPLSRIPRSVSDYFRQRFAQVTNPAIDPLRESLVMSLTMRLGRRGSAVAEGPTGWRLLRIEHPVLLTGEAEALRGARGFRAATVHAVWTAAAGPDALAPALDRLGRDAARAVRRGASLLIVSDRTTDRDRAPIPLLVAVGAVHQHLLRAGLRQRVGLVAEAGDAWNTHHVAALVGYGAEAVHPWIALRSLPASAREKFRDAVENGLLKVLAKMGIATLSSYAGAQIFEALGLGAAVIDRCFTGTRSPLGGIGFREIAEDVLTRHRAAYPDGPPPTGLPDHGHIRYRKEGEDHGWAPPLVRLLQSAVDGRGPEGYRRFAGAVDTRPPAGPRDLLGFAARRSVPLHRVEPVDAIRRRFVSSAMSLGALSPEAHAALAIGMNRMGARSNSGEGGEDPASYAWRPGGDRADNRIKQVASARFGVTTEYLVRADELEIKIAQGSKPGEGGQLPGHKVTELIARLRHAVPGIALISPPPHHDIYSIEDLAQLIHDLKQVNPRARVGVKLVAETGVGTVAAGVAKAFADYVLVSGYNGGTGASPLASIKHAGMPWELGLAETHRVLLANGLRDRIEVRVDGGLRTGRDVVIAAALGAEAFGFGTASVVALGCAMARQCHLNTCPTGIATQRPDLRKKFRGTPEQVVAYFTLVAQEVREMLAALGLRRLDDVVGRVEVLRQLDRPDAPRARLLDLSALLAPVPRSGPPRRRPTGPNIRPDVVSLDAEILTELDPALQLARPFTGSYAIGNHHLTVGARIAGHVVRRLGAAGPDAPVRLQFRGSAGQSFGAFAVPGLHLDLEGEANDHVGKGLCGGEITIRPFREAAYAEGAAPPALIGNTALYGATAGRLFAAGAAGDRFAVRNSGAVAVIEGAGHHCCEYMTGGAVVVLGPVGRNLGAGMSNGVAYVLDETTVLESRCNLDMVSVTSVEAEDEHRLHALVWEHATKTGSVRARRVLEHWHTCRALFRKVHPRAPVAAAARPKRAPAIGAPLSRNVEVRS